MKLQQVMAFLRQWGWLILLGTAVAGSTAFLINQNTTPVYQAAATWLIDEPAKHESQQPTAADYNPARTYAAILPTQPVVAETIDRLDLPLTTAQLQARITAVSPDNYQLITIRVEDTDPQQAARIAATLGEVLADQTASRDAQRFAEPLANWQQQIAAHTAEIARIEAELAADDGTNAAQLESQLTAAEALYNTAFEQFNGLLAAAAQESIAFLPIEPAQTAPQPLRPRTAAATIWAATAGALASLFIVGFARRAGWAAERSETTAVNPTPAPLISSE